MRIGIDLRPSAGSRGRSVSTLALAGVVACSIFALSAIAQVAPPRAPATAPSPPEALTVFTEGRYPEPTARRTTIYYSRPAVTGRDGQPRKIWGGLVPWDKPWRMGANQATLLVSQSTLKFGDVTVPAGTPVTLYMIPTENGPSQLILNKQVGQSGVDYDASQDLGRAELKRDALTDRVERLILAIDTREGGGTLKIAWDDAQYSIPFTVVK